MLFSLDTSSTTRSQTGKNQGEPTPDEGPSVQTWLLTEIQVRYQTEGQQSDYTPHCVKLLPDGPDLCW